MIEINIAFIFLISLLLRFFLREKTFALLNFTEELGTRKYEAKFVTTIYFLSWLILLVYLWFVDSSDVKITYHLVVVPLLFISVIVRRLVSIVSITKLEKIYISDNIILDSLFLLLLVLHLVLLNVPSVQFVSGLDKFLLCVSTLTVLVSTNIYSRSYEASEKKISSYGSRHRFFWGKLEKIIIEDYKIKIDFVSIFMSLLLIHRLFVDYSQSLKIAFILAVLLFTWVVNKKAEDIPYGFFLRENKKMLLIATCVILIILLLRVVFGMA